MVTPRNIKLSQVCATFSYLFDLDRRVLVAGVPLIAVLESYRLGTKLSNHEMKRHMVELPANCQQLAARLFWCSWEYVINKVQKRHKMTTRWRKTYELLWRIILIALKNYLDRAKTLLQTPKCVAWSCFEASCTWNPPWGAHSFAGCAWFFPLYALACLSEWLHHFKKMTCHFLLSKCLWKVVDSKSIASALVKLFVVYKIVEVLQSFEI